MNVRFIANGKRLRPLHKRYQAQKIKASDAQKCLVSAEQSDKETKHARKALDEENAKLKIIAEDLKESSFGLEHILRELGQFYESTCVALDLENRLPELMAELLLMGIPLEIMDGDVSHVAMTWIKAVFKALEIKLGNAKLYVESILGLQSSGKSTLLNTMHGLRPNHR